MWLGIKPRHHPVTFGTNWRLSSSALVPSSFRPTMNAMRYSLNMASNHIIRPKNYIPPIHISSTTPSVPPPQSNLIPPLEIPRPIQLPQRPQPAATTVAMSFIMVLPIAMSTLAAITSKSLITSASHPRPVFPAPPHPYPHMDQSTNLFSDFRTFTNIKLETLPVGVWNVALPTNQARTALCCKSHISQPDLKMH